MKEKCFDKAAQVWTTTFECAWSVSFCPETLQEQLSLSVCVPQRSWMCKSRVTYCLYWRCCLCRSLLTIQKACSIFQYTTCANISVSNINLLSVTASTQFFFLFCYYDWSLMSKIHVTDCVNAAAWYLSSFALDLWKSWTWCVLICLCALCIVCSHMSVRPRSVLRSHSCVLERSWRRGTSASSFIATVRWKWNC